MAGMIVILSGYSGAGKTHTIDGYLARNFARGKNTATRILTSTTRTMREGEVDGRDYNFLEPKDFEQKVIDEKFVEHSMVYGGNYYGTLTEDFARARNDFAVAIWILDIQGAEKMIQKFPGAHSVFLAAPKDDIEKRLLTRGQSLESIALRLGAYERETEMSRLFDRIITNKQDKLGDTIQVFTSSINQWLHPSALVRKKTKNLSDE